MTADEFRRLALSLPETTEQSHMGHPDFRVGGKIFATLGWPEGGWGMVKLTLDQRDAFVGASPAGFSPVPGGWGERGATRVLLAKAPADLVEEALLAAWRNAALNRFFCFYDTSESG